MRQFLYTTASFIGVLVVVLLMLMWSVIDHPPRTIGGSAYPDPPELTEEQRNEIINYLKEVEAGATEHTDK